MVGATKDLLHVLFDTRPNAVVATVSVVSTRLYERKRRYRRYLETTRSIFEVIKQRSEVLSQIMFIGAISFVVLI